MITKETLAKMTNREYVISLTNEGLAKFISKGVTDCSECPIDDYCHYDANFVDSLCYHNWLKWLKDEHREVKE